MKEIVKTVAMLLLIATAINTNAMEHGTVDLSSVTPCGFYDTAVYSEGFRNLEFNDSRYIVPLDPVLEPGSQVSIRMVVETGISNATQIVLCPALGAVNESLVINNSEGNWTISRGGQPIRGFLDKAPAPVSTENSIHRIILTINSKRGNALVKTAVGTGDFAVNGNLTAKLTEALTKCDVKSFTLAEISLRGCNSAIRRLDFSTVMTTILLIR